MAIIHDLKVVMKAIITQTELLDQAETSKQPKRNSGQTKYVLENNSDYPAVLVPSDELHTRLADMMKCFYYGYRADPLDSPPVVETDDASVITAISATLNGRVTGAGCTVGFQFGTTRELTTGGGTVVATGSPTGVQATIKQVTYAAAGLTTKTKYYFRMFAQYSATGNTQYGIIKSFTTL
jgi:hypothetical protein